MKSLILGTAGHVDHGKTALIRALTGVETDRWEEERRRGITIDLGFAPLPLPSGEAEISVVDVPGHEDFVKNMLAGATGVDLLLLAVAADEGPMPQTNEHLWIARYLGVRHGVVAITKSDLVDPDWIELVRSSIADELQRILGHRNWPVVTVSAQTGAGLSEARDAIATAARQVTPREEDDLFRCPVDRSFTVRGVGTVVTGTIWSGRVSLGEELRILPDDKVSRVRGVQVHGAESATAQAGQRVALALVGIEKDQVPRGTVLCASPVWKSSRYVDATAHVSLDSPHPLTHWQRVRFHLGTAEMMGRVVVFGDDVIAPGDAGYVQLRLERPVVARWGDRFVLRFYSPVTTIGGGTIVDPWARRRGRGGGDLERMKRLCEGDAAARVAWTVAARDGGVETDSLSVLAGVPPRKIEAIVRSLEEESRVLRLGERSVPGRAVAEAREAVLAALRRGHDRDVSASGVPLEALRGGSRHPKAVVNEALRQLETEGAIRVEGSLAALHEHTPRLTARQQSLAASALEAIRRGGLAPPALGDLAAELEVTEEELLPVLKFLRREGGLVALTPDLFVERVTVESAIGRITQRLRRSAARPAELREMLGVSRKYLIPLLEYLDSSGVTRRTPAGRVLREDS